MHTHNFPTSKIEVRYVTPDPMLIGPTPHRFKDIWAELIDINSWPAWVIGVDKVLADETTTMARGSLFNVVGLFGPGEIEVLRWDLGVELVLLLRMNGLRLAFSVHLNSDMNSDMTIDVEGEYELTGWKKACGAVFRYYLQRQQQKMVDRLELMINHGSNTH